MPAATFRSWVGVAKGNPSTYLTAATAAAATSFAVSGVNQSYGDGVSATSTAWTSATAAFVAADVGRTITGTNIPSGTTISSVTNATTLVLSASTTGTGSSLFFTIVSRFVVPAASTVYVVDGAKSEALAVSAGGGTATLTVAAAANAHAIGTPIYWQLTASIGPVDYIPVTAFPDAADNIATVSDTGLRGSNVSEYAVVDVAGDSDINLAGDVIPDTFGYLLGSIFGAVDFSGGSPNSHTFAGMNTAASNGQPTELMLWVYNGVNTRLYLGAKASDLTLTYDPMMLFKWTAKFKAFLSGVVTTPTVSFSAIGPQATWQATTTIGGTLVPNLMTATIDIKRASVDAIQTIDGNQSPYKIWSGPLQVSGTLDTVMEDDTYILDFLNNSQPATVITLTNGTGGTQVSVAVTLTKCNFLTGWKATGGSPWVRAGGPIAGVANTTDANTAGGGYSPARVVLKNAKATGSYQ